MSRIDEIALGIFMIGFAICIAFTGTAQAWGEDSPYSTTRAWLSDIEYCDPSFTVMVSNANNSQPNAFNYTLNYTLQYRDAGGSILNEEITTETYNITLGAGTYIWLPHNINVNTIMNIISEVDECENNPYRVVRIDLDFTYCDVGGCYEDSGDYKIIDFTNCDPVSGTGYGEPLTPSPDTDYGFDLEGRGTEGGSGSIYEGIDLYGSTGSDESGMGVGFSWIFFGLIPIIFLFAVFKFCQRVLWRGD